MGMIVIIGLVAGCFAGAIHALVKIIRIERSKIIWGEIISFEYLGMPERKPHEDPDLPDYLIEVKYEFEGEAYINKSVIKKDIHYENGGKIKLFLPNGDIERAIINYNVRSSAYVQLILMIFLAAFILWQALYGTSLVLH